MKSAYYLKKSRRDVEKGSCSDVSERGAFWKTLWKLRALAILKNFLWKVSNDIIPTKENLHQRKITPRPTVPLLW
jgi:DNA polymerase sigma